MLLFRRTLAGWRNGKIGISWYSTKGNANNVHRLVSGRYIPKKADNHSKHPQNKIQEVCLQKRRWLWAEIQISFWNMQWVCIQSVNSHTISSKDPAWWWGQSWKSQQGLYAKRKPSREPAPNWPSAISVPIYAGLDTTGPRSKTQPKPTGWLKAISGYRISCTARHWSADIPTEEGGFGMLKIDLSWDGDQAAALLSPSSEDITSLPPYWEAPERTDRYFQQFK